MINVKPFVLSGDWKSFLTMSTEKLLVVTRRHFIVLVGPFVSLLAVGIIFVASSIYFFSAIYSSKLLLLSCILTIVSIVLTLSAKIIIDWYFNLYVATSRKLLEVKYSPLISFNFNQVLLDQVKCTELDMSKSGILSDFIDVGSIGITFDRPTHYEVFYFENIPESKEIGIHLSNEYAELGKLDNKNQYWFRQNYNNPTNRMNYMEEVFPNG